MKKLLIYTTVILSFILVILWSYNVDKKQNAEWNQVIEFSRQSVITHCKLTNETLKTKGFELLDCNIKGLNHGN